MRGTSIWGLLFSNLVAASPQVAFPFNSQVPVVARVEEPYEYQLAATTFTSDDGSSLDYTLTGAPAWLNLNSATRTLYGTPGQGNTGPNAFQITATASDGSVDMGCTLVVASDSPPMVSGNITDDLARSGPLAGPSTLLLQPSDAFAITFSDDVFQDDPGRIKAYYATMSDHTPLPSWIKFESDTLAFWGITPVLATGSQTFVVNLIASDVVGFAGAFASFTLLVTNNQLAFSVQTENVTVTAGKPVSLKSFRDQLLLNGKQLTNSQLRNAAADTPSWLTFQNDTFELMGTPPQDFKAQTVTINVTDVYGDTASKSVYLHTGNASLFGAEIGNLTATAGKPFTYIIGQSVLDQKDLNVSVDLGAASSWLDFDPSKLELHGTPPIDARAADMNASLTASSPSTTDSQEFMIKLSAATIGGMSTTSRLSSRASPTNASTATASGAPTASTSKGDSKVGIIVGVVIGVLALLALLFAVVMLMCRRRRRDSNQKEKLPISRPIMPYSDQEPMITDEHQQQHDLERAIGSPVKHAPDEPPRLDVALPMSSNGPARMKSIPENSRAGRSRLSVVSSIGDAEATIRGDSNIPVFGRASGHIHTPHDSYSAATELARRNSRASHLRLSEFAKVPPKQRTSKMTDSWYSQNNDGGLGIRIHGSVIHRPKRGSRMSSGFSVSRDEGSGVSMDTYGTSMLSNPSAELPKSPTKRNSRTAPTVTLTEAEKRRSIRLVSRSGSLTDARPLAEKRQSFIRNRASSSIISPLFASSRRSSNLGLYSSMGSLNRRNSSVRRPTRDRSQRTTTSATSSMEPPPRNPRRLASGTLAFAPSFPRAINPSPILPNSPTSPSAAGAAETVEADDSDNYTTATSGTSNSLAFTASSDTRAAAVIESELALPRDKRNWVLPGEASPTPPPPSQSRLPRPTAREAARKKWAERLNRNSQGDLVSRSPSPLRCQLSGVSEQGLRCRKERLRKGQGQEEDKENTIGPVAKDRLSALVSHDSFNGRLRAATTATNRASIGVWGEAPRISSSRAGVVHDGHEDTVSGQTNRGRIDEEDDSEDEWEDVAVVLGSPKSNTNSFVGGFVAGSTKGSNGGVGGGLRSTGGGRRSLGVLTNMSSPSSASVSNSFSSGGIAFL